MAPDAFTRAFCAPMPATNLVEIHNGLCHPMGYMNAPFCKI